MWHEPLAPAFADALRNPALQTPHGLTGPNGKTAGKRFNVYRNNVAYGLVEALGKNYPAVKAQCGNAKFSDAARLYFDDHPPKTRIMFQLGEHFSSWLDQFEPAKVQMPWLADLARVECCWLAAYHAADIAPLPHEALGAVHPDQLGAVKFIKHPAAHLINSNYAIHAMHSAGRNHLAANPQGGETVLVTRPQFAVETRLLPQATAHFMGHILGGQTLNDAVEAALGSDVSFDLSAAFSGLLQSGATTALYH